MRKYQVLSSEVIWYKAEVEAENYIQAKDLVESGEVGVGDEFDSDSFQVSSAYILSDDITHIENLNCDNCGVELDSENHHPWNSTCFQCDKEIGDWRSSNG